MNQLKEIRRSKGMSQEDLAKLLQTTKASVSRYEREDQRITLPLLQRLSKALRCSISELIGEKEFNQQTVQITMLPNSKNKGTIMIDKGILESVNIQESTKGNFCVGDNMSPTIKHDDFFLVDTELLDIQQNGIFLIEADGDAFLVRSTRNKITKATSLSYDNPLIENIGEVKIKDVKVIGQVTGTFKSQLQD